MTEKRSKEKQGQKKNKNIVYLKLKNNYVIIELETVHI